jgi:micrococcal nuclease
MPVLIPRLALALLLGAALLAGGASLVPVAAQTSCDPAYPDFCIPPVGEVGDLNCPDISGTWFTVYPPDPHGLDGDGNGIGCES